MPDTLTFLQWLADRSPTIPLLEEFLQSLGQEWLRTEHKAATTDIDAGLRREVAALQNTRGGNVFLGVLNDKSIAGTPITVERIRQVLAQSSATPPNDECITDLNLAVNSVL